MLACRDWSPPAGDSRVVNLPTGVGGGAQALTEAPSGMIEVTGNWSHFVCCIAAPANWIDVTFRLTARIEGIDVPMDTIALAAIPLVHVASDGTISAMLFNVSGVAFEKMRVEAWRTAVEHLDAQFSARAWWEDGEFSARVEPAPFALWAPTGQQRSFTTPAGFAAGVTGVFTANPLPRGRVAVTSLDWTRSEAVLGRLVLRETPGAVVRAVYQNSAAAGPVPQQRGKPGDTAPLVSAPGSGWEVSMDVGAAGFNDLNIQGFDV